MNHLEKLSDVACQAERLSETQLSSSSSHPERKIDTSSIESSSTPQSVSPSCSSSSSSSNAPSRNPSCDAISDNDRCSIRDKIKNAFRKRSNESYEDLLELCTNLAEESVFYHAPSRLDYYKSGIQEVKRIFEKADEIKTICKNGKSTENTEEGQRSLKRLKTQH
mmetsp:Transcript_31479/g.34404  ORF Transcript_31479/g.34404 Transcript_31479/m.34404 type:complete len:165 (-) Transcript_31479:465-959(-)|eukprot:CAMPEP_0173150558 /NCGR_PEP_ID=MMETSP1105-20130129/11037_1 /TAXON_ID=2985 /ORGANISM="Ochromonas sp., Strain BG-1" /LENGTH=164 /DNA_ID=CAMNT_0014065727 /DNA_START=141 /DNA_END=635 /DNA_ORIENTATION=+